MSTGAVQAVIEAGGEPASRLLERLERRLAELASGHGEFLARYGGDTIAAGGKRLRPLLVFLAAGTPPPETEGLLRAAVSVELIHSATLVHDDVLDGAALRRGRPTVVAAAGRRMATATGDLLFSRAFAELPRPARCRPSAFCRARARARSRRADAARGRLAGGVAGPLPRALPVEDRGAVSGGLRARCDRGRWPGAGARRVRGDDRGRVSAARRRARRVRAAVSHRQAARHRPARRDDHPAAADRARTRP